MNYDLRKHMLALTRLYLKTAFSNLWIDIDFLEWKYIDMSFECPLEYNAYRILCIEMFSLQYEGLYVF